MLIDIQGAFYKSEDHKMNTLSRREARKEIIGLLFETEFKKDEQVQDILEIALEDRELPDDEYVKAAYLGICERLSEIDGLINKHARGWKT